jgi:hypothetical protein
MFVKPIWPVLSILAFTPNIPVSPASWTPLTFKSSNTCGRHPAA